MSKRNRSSVERYHDRVAGIYDTIYDGNPYWETVFDITWRHILKHLPRDHGTRCLDIGCGTGRWGLRLAKSGYTTDFLDISQNMIDQVAGKLEKTDTPFVTAECMAPTPLPVPRPADTKESILYHASIDDLSAIPKASYGFIVGQGDPLNCAERHDRALKDLTRILKPGGVMLMSVDNRYAGIYHYFKQNDVDGLKQFLKTGKTNWVTDEEGEQYPMTMFTPDQIRRMCEARGLKLLSLIGKTVLPLRRFRAMLDDRQQREEVIRIEESLNGVESMLSNAAHLEFVARKPE